MTSKWFSAGVVAVVAAMMLGTAPTCPVHAQDWTDSDAIDFADGDVAYDDASDDGRPVFQSGAVPILSPFSISASCLTIVITSCILADRDPDTARDVLAAMNGHTTTDETYIDDEPYDDALTDARYTSDAAHDEDDDPAALYDSDDTDDQRFDAYAQLGRQALEDQEYDTAIRAFQAALMQKDDPDIFDLLQQTIERAVKPRIAVTDFTVSGTWKLANPPQDFADLFLPKLSRERYQLIERTRLDELLKEQDLTIAGLVNSDTLRDKPLLGIRYLVMGSAIRGEPSILSARLVDVVTGEIAQTAQVTMDSDRDLSRALDDLAAMIAMTDEEKAAYAQARQQQAWEEDDAQERALQAADRAEQELAWRQRQQDAYTQWMQVKALMARGNYDDAQWLARQCMYAYADTSYAEDFDALYEQSSRLAAREAATRRNDRAALDELARLERLRETARFDRHVEQGRRAMNARDYATAIECFRQALTIRDDREVRSWMDQCRQRAQKPRLAVVAFGQTAGVGLDAVFNGFSSASYDFVTQQQMERYCRDKRITLRTDMSASALAPLADTVQYAVLVNVSKSGNYYTVQVRLLDLRARKETGTMRYDGIADRAELQRVLARAGRDVQDPRAAAQYQRDRQQYERLMETARAEFARKRWTQAQDAYRKAYQIQPSSEALNGITLCTRRIEEERKSADAAAQKQRDQQRYDDAMSKARAAYNRMNYEEAQRQASLALSIKPRDVAAQRLLDDCRAKLAAPKPGKLGQGQPVITPKPTQPTPPKPTPAPPKNDPKPTTPPAPPKNDPAPKPTTPPAPPKNDPAPKPTTPPAPPKNDPAPKPAPTPAPKQPEKNDPPPATKPAPEPTPKPTPAPKPTTPPAKR